MKCKMCEAFYKAFPLTDHDHLPSVNKVHVTPIGIFEPVKCAFDDAKKSYDAWNENWMCRTLIALRDLGNEQYCDDETLCVIKYNGNFIVLQYYKHRGHTKSAVVFSGDGFGEITLPQAEYVIDILGVKDRAMENENENEKEDDDDSSSDT